MMAKCDLCGEHTKKQLTPLREALQVHGVTDLCEDCMSLANKIHSKLLSVALKAKVSGFKVWLKRAKRGRT